jgi:hypothetical protein
MQFEIAKGKVKLQDDSPSCNFTTNENTWFPSDAQSCFLAVVKGMVHGVVSISKGHIGRTGDGLKNYFTNNIQMLKTVNFNEFYYTNDCNIKLF